MSDYEKQDGFYSYNHQTPGEGFPPYEAPKPKKKSGAGKIIALALCFSLIGSALGAGGVLLGQGIMNKKSAVPGGEVTAMLEGLREKSVIQTVQVDTSKLLTPAEVYAANAASTVGITTSITTQNFWGFPTQAAAAGSGFIISSDGYILTNYHVIEDSDTVTVAMYDGTTYDAKIVGYDESNDIAVLKVDAENLTPVVLGDSDNLNVGDDVVAIGNPLGELTFSLTRGSVSAMDRQVTMSGGLTMNLIQTDTAINSGNSGGALFNLHGEVVGVVNAKYSGSSSSGATIDNIGFAIPINTVRPIVESIIEKGYIAKPYIGVSLTDVGQDAAIYGLPQGAVIREVVEDSPAEKAGLQVGDIVTRANGQDITGSNDLVKIVKAMSAGDSLDLTVYRKGETMELTLTVEEQIQNALAQEEIKEQSAQQGMENFPFWGFMR